MKFFVTFLGSFMVRPRPTTQSKWVLALQQRVGRAYARERLELPSSYAGVRGRKSREMGAPDWTKRSISGLEFQQTFRFYAFIYNSMRYIGRSLLARAAADAELEAVGRVADAQRAGLGVAHEVAVGLFALGVRVQLGVLGGDRGSVKLKGKALSCWVGKT